MNFEDFAADTDSTVFLKASEPELQGTIKFIVTTQLFADRLGVKNPVHVEEGVESCKAQRKKIIAACQHAFRREPSHRVTLTDADFEEVSPPQPPSDVEGT